MLLAYMQVQNLVPCAPQPSIGQEQAVVFGMSNKRKNELRAASGNISMSMSRRDVIASGNRQMEIIGPLLEDDAAKLHE